MLLLGYLGEIDVMSIANSVIVELYFSFILSIIWEYAKYSKEYSMLFYFLFVVWGLYAVAALMKAKYKNISIIY